MKIAFRVDASSQIGTGHFMRCLTLAEGLKQSGARIRFVSRQLPEHLRNSLADKGFEFALLDNGEHDFERDELAHAHWLGTSQAQDADDSIRALSDQFWDWLVVDHYALDFRWERLVRQSTEKILVIDDIADRQHDCDLLLDQNLYADMEARYISKVSAHCRLLLGPSYALLRDEFRKAQEHIKPRTAPIKRVLVFFGGIDADNHTRYAINALFQMSAPKPIVDVVIGAQHPFREEIEIMCAQYGFVCHVQTVRMAELMALADLAIGAGGSASWERCCLGLPCIVGAVAENQVQAAKHLATFGAVRYIGEAQEITTKNLKQHIEEASQQDWLSNASLRCLGLVDGKGITRVIEMMEKI